jgi:RNA recognition motif-containing protein
LELNDKEGLYVTEFKTKEQREMELKKQSFNIKAAEKYHNLYVKGFDLLTEESELEEFFKQFGEINSIKIPTGAEYGFVSFKDRESARKAKEVAP